MTILSTDEARETPVLACPPPLDVAARHLGPASARYLGEAEVEVRWRGRVRGGASELDAWLAEVFLGAREDPALASEFWGWAHRTLTRCSGSTPAQVRSVVAEEDLVQSVLGDLSADAAELTFETRAQFIRLLIRRHQWKQRDRIRGAVSGRRREDLRAPASSEELPLPSGARTPQSLVGGREEAIRVLRCIQGLPTRDRHLVRMRMRGADLQEVAAELDLSLDSARRAMSRALERLRSCLG